MIKIIKNSKESFERFLGRFHKKVRKARIINEVRDKRFFQKKPTKRRIRAAAIIREYHRAQREKMKYY